VEVHWPGATEAQVFTDVPTDRPATLTRSG